MPAGDDLTIVLFLFGCALPFVIEAVKAETMRYRVAFSCAAALFVAAGIIRPHLKDLWPVLYDKITDIATSPSDWFVLSALIFGLLSFRYSNKKTIAEPIINVVAPQPKSINWIIWKHRNEFTVYEFSHILSRLDPSGSKSTTEASSYGELILEDIRAKRLNYIPKIVSGYNGSYERTVDLNTNIKRYDAITWASSKGFAVDHIV